MISFINCGSEKTGMYPSGSKLYNAREEVDSYIGAQ